MAPYQAVIAYDGTVFSGMQRQAKARTVQGVVEDALRQIGWQGRSILAAGRTDAGVHASGQVIAFDISWPHSSEELKNAVNANLPEDVAVKSLAEAEEGFHPRYDALARSYRYRIYCQPQRDPLRERFAWRVWPALALERLQAAADFLKGVHDFARFGKPPKEGGATTREVFSAGWEQRDDEFIFEISANAFLYHMVRRLVGLQVEVGRGALEPAVFQQLLSGEADELVRGLAPPQGLTLVKVRYPVD